VIRGVVEMGSSRIDLHEVLIRHVPVRRRWCRAPAGHLTIPEVAVCPPGDPIAGGRGRSRLVRGFIPRGYVDRGGNEFWWTGRYQ
jgi:hypothetical protein